MTTEQSNLGFWGAVLTPGENFKTTPPPNRVLRISSAALDPKSGNKPQSSLVIYDSSKQTEFVIATLIGGVVPSTHLDLFFVGDVEITFKVVGNSNIHLTGYTTFLEGERLEESDEEIEFLSGLPDGKNKADQKQIAQSIQTIVDELKAPSQDDEDSESDIAQWPGSALGPLGLVEEDDEEEDDEEEDDDLIGLPPKKTPGGKGKPITVEGDEKKKSATSPPTPSGKKPQQQQQQQSSSPNQSKKRKAGEDTQQTGSKKQQRGPKPHQPPKAAGKQEPAKGGPKPPQAQPGQPGKKKDKKEKANTGTIKCTGCDKMFASAKGMEQHASAKHKK